MRYLKVFILTMFLVSTASAQQSDGEVAAAIKAANASYSLGYDLRMPEMIGAIHTETARVMPPNRPALQGREAVMDMIREDLAMGDYSLTLESQLIERIGDTAIEVGVYTAEIIMEDGTVIKDEGNTMVIWKMQPDGTWLMDKDIYNSTLPLGF